MMALDDEFLVYLQTWARSTEAIVGAMLRKYKVKISEPDRKNIRVVIESAANDFIRVQFRYRDSLRWVDMGAGSGYAKGRMNPHTYRSALDPFRSRKKKPITNKPIYARLAILQSVVVGQLKEQLIGTGQLLSTRG